MSVNRRTSGAPAPLTGMLFVLASCIVFEKPIPFSSTIGGSFSRHGWVDVDASSGAAWLVLAFSVDEGLSLVWIVDGWCISSASIIE